MTQQQQMNVTVRVEPGSDGFDAVVKALQAGGLTKVEPHRRFGIVNGTVAADCIVALRAVAGVASVREDRRYRAQPAG